MSRAWVPYVAHLAPVAWLFWGALFGGELPYFRDVSFLYYPNYVFLERSLRQGVWPLWNPTCDAGGPFLQAYLPDLALVLLGGARRALAFVAPLHIFVAMCGATALAGRLGLGPWGRWAAGVFFGASGYMLSATNLIQVLQGAALAPWVLAAFLGVVERPRRRAVAALAALAALQISTLSGEAALSTAVAGILLLRRRPGRPALLALAGAGLLAALLAAPAILGVLSLLAGTRRAGGFGAAEALEIAAPPLALAEAVLPRFFGDVHAMTEVGYWGYLVYPRQFPYFLSLYVGPWPLLLAAGAGRGSWRFGLLLALGVVLVLGAHGPAAPILPLAFQYFRHPVKLLLIAVLGLSLLAGRGLDRAVGPGRRPALAVASLAGAFALALLARWPDLPARGLGGWFPELRDRRALEVARQRWPAALLATGSLGAGIGLALAAGARFAPAAGVLAALDLLIVNTTLNPSAPRTFYEPRPELRSLLERATPAGLERWFSFGAANTPELRWSPEVLRLNSRAWYYYVNRQWLLPRSHVLEGLETAFDIERAGWEPPGSTLAMEERRAVHYPQLHRWLRLANVRWVLSGVELPDALVAERARAWFPEIAEPLRLYEVRDALPRALWVPRAEGVPSAQAAIERMFRDDFEPREVAILEGEAPVAGPGEPPRAPAVVSLAAPDLHTRVLRVHGPPGWVVLLEGHHPAWRAEGPGGRVTLRPANGRYLAFRTAGGDETYQLRYAPGWLWPSLALLAAGLVAVVFLSLEPPFCSRPLTGPKAAR